MMIKRAGIVAMVLGAACMAEAQIAPVPPSMTKNSKPKVIKMQGMPGVSRNTNHAVVPSKRPAIRPPATVKAVRSKSSGSSTSRNVRSDLRLNFQTTPLDIVLQDYSEKTGKTLLRAPGLPSPMITLRSQGALTLNEYLSAIETVLSMNGVGLVPTGEKFVRVVPVAEVVSTPGDIRSNISEGLLDDDTGKLVNQLIMLKNITVADATKAVQPLLHKYGKIIPFESINAIMVMDEVGNINRALQVIRMIDQPVVSLEEPLVVQIRYAKATEIKQKLMEIIADQNQNKSKSTVARTRSSGSPGYTRSPAGVIRARRPTTSKPTEELMKEAERGVIHGNVKIIADERTNKLIIITRPVNMPFFENILKVLDVETAPVVTVKVVRLEFAEAKKVEGMLNDLIGATSKNNKSATSGNSSSSSARYQALRAYTERLKQSAKSKSNVGELSKDNIKILSDERTNALVIMASKADLATLTEIIKQMDMMLSQVLIEAVIIDVKLGGTLETGVTWIQRSLTTYKNNADGSRDPFISFRGKFGGSLQPPDRGEAMSDFAKSLPQGGGLGYFLTLHNLNLSAVIKAVAADTRTKVISTPVLLTTDNTEATLKATEKVYVYRGQPTYYSGAVTSRGDTQYDQQDIGLELTVTPHINENKVVMMDIKQTISEPGDQAGVDPDNLAGKTISRDREIEASIAVSSGQTIVLGGQVREGKKRSRAKVPILGSIPLIGRLFSSNTSDNARTETIVFITPYVLDTPGEVEAATRKRRDALEGRKMWHRGWSDSNLAMPPEKHFWERDKKEDKTVAKDPDEAKNDPAARERELDAAVEKILKRLEEKKAEQNGAAAPKKSES